MKVWCYPSSYLALAFRPKQANDEMPHVVNMIFIISFSTFFLLISPFTLFSLQSLVRLWFFSLCCPFPIQYPYSHLPYVIPSLVSPLSLCSTFLRQFHPLYCFFLDIVPFPCNYLLVQAFSHVINQLCSFFPVQFLFRVCLLM